MLIPRKYSTIPKNTKDSHDRILEHLWLNQTLLEKSAQIKNESFPPPDGDKHQRYLKPQRMVLVGLKVFFTIPAGDSDGRIPESPIT